MATLQEMKNGHVHQTAEERIHEKQEEKLEALEEERKKLDTSIKDPKKNGGKRTVKDQMHEMDELEQTKKELTELKQEMNEPHDD